MPRRRDCCFKWSSQSHEGEGEDGEDEEEMDQKEEARASMGSMGRRGQWKGRRWREGNRGTKCAGVKKAAVADELFPNIYLLFFVKPGFGTVTQILTPLAEQKRQAAADVLYQYSQFVMEISGMQTSLKKESLPAPSFPGSMAEPSSSRARIGERSMSS
ncbi:hypothetical protein AXF42_Ash012294 [Apostasia shenzhenica]|uniref:Uncharacterized protein n=1 Tax=Apostasia shenzhenica TaxID=1088818 RepID=A0A2I0B4I9_9ASPA|nr:hypothetical protein AXF42_Ash012294 [Apostasia shenzhenica]